MSALHDRARAMRADGKLLREIAEELGVDVSYVSRICSTKYQCPKCGRRGSSRPTEACRRCRRRAAARRTPCTQCGGPTSRPGTKTCRKCWHKWSPELIVERIREWSETHGRPPSASDWNPSLLIARGDEGRARDFDRPERGHWPLTATVQTHFGSWSKALEAAGVKSNSAGRPGWRRKRGAA